MDKSTSEMTEQDEKDRKNVLPLLQKTQETKGYISQEALKEIAHSLEMSENEIYSIASFYPFFRFSSPDSSVSAAAPAQEPIKIEPTPRKGEIRIALRNAGQIDPEKIEDAIAREGYAGFSKALKMTPEEVIEEVKKSGLRGRGGAGYPASEKWRDGREAPGTEKYLICNAAEGDPQAASSRALLENDPHAVLEGMLIAAYASGADQGIICINREYTLAVSRLKNALGQMKEQGLLGNNLQGSSFSFNIDMAEMPCTVVSGEETILICALEGKRPMSQVRPPYPAISGLEGKPTMIHNAETLASVSAIFQKGAEWFAGIGTEQSKGTKVFTLTGDIAKPGIIEVPFGTTLRTIVFDLGGGITNKKEFKAIRTGGPTGGFLSSAFLDTPIDYESLVTAGSMIGSGILWVLNNEHCAVDLAQKALILIENESCGKCVYCREGTIQLAEILTDITEGRGKPTDPDLMVELGEAMKQGAFCNFGKNAANPVLTTVRDYRNEYEAHIKERRCTLKICKKLEAA